MKAQKDYKSIILSCIKKLSLMFLFVFLLFSFIDSFSSAFVSTDYYSFSKSFSENKTNLVDSRIIVGLKDNLAKKNADKSEQKKIGLRGPITSYGVGVNIDDQKFSIGSETITPIESNLLSYIWSDKSEPNYLIQYLSINNVAEDISFDDKENIICLSKALYNSLGNPTLVSVYSYVIKQDVQYKVIGYYDNENSKKLQSVFYNVYQEPVFFNNFGFKTLYSGKEDYFENIQTDIIISFDSEYSDIVYNIFNEKHWKDSFIKYSLFDPVYTRMNQLNTRSILYNVLLGVVLLVALIALVIIVFKYYKRELIDSISFCNPYILICIWAAVIFAVFGLSKLIKSNLLFFEPSIGITITFAVIFIIIQTVIYMYVRNKRKEQINEN